MNANEKRAYEFEMKLDKALRKLQIEAATLNMDVTVIGGSQLTRTPARRRSLYRAGRMSKRVADKYELDLIRLWRHTVLPFEKAYVNTRGMTGTIGLGDRRFGLVEPTLISEHEKEIAVKFARLGPLPVVQRPADHGRVIDIFEDDDSDFPLGGDVIESPPKKTAHIKSKLTLHRLRNSQMHGNQKIAERIAREQGISVDDAKRSKEYKKDADLTTYMHGHTR